MAEKEFLPELHAALDTAERDYRYKGIGPDWAALAKMVVEAAKGQVAGG